LQSVGSDNSNVENAKIGLEAIDDEASLSEEQSDGDDSKDEELAQSSLRHIYNISQLTHTILEALKCFQPRKTLEQL